VAHCIICIVRVYYWVEKFICFQGSITKEGIVLEERHAFLLLAHSQLILAHSCFSLILSFLCVAGTACLCRLTSQQDDS
jgi:hypothetical protein